jgi:polyisoprenoid-binding protein YceI
MKKELQTLLLVCTLFTAYAGFADNHSYVQRWVADPTKSQLRFVATQEGAEFSGRFSEFTSSLELQIVDTEIALLELGAVIQLGSVDTQYGERDDYLKQADWFHIDVWPEARYKASAIRQLGDNQFVADGELTLRDIKQPIQIAHELTLEENGERGQLTGTASLSRLDFGVGQGDWTDTKWVGDEVKVQFDLHILRAFE